MNKHVNKALKGIAPHKGCPLCVCNVQLYSNVALQEQCEEYVTKFNEALKNGWDSFPCHHGQYHFKEKKFGFWKITPSSEDKGFSLP